jgi:non-ribosomal peptide synthetase-like protein
VHLDKIRIGAGATVGSRSTLLPGARIGKGAEVQLGDGATVNRGCVVQTHLFHDRIMSMDGVRIEEGATLGPNGIILPGASIGAGTTVGPGSLVTRGDSVPPASRWLGNPITTWS